MIDGDTRKRLARGGFPIDAKLDLHGYTEDAAYEALMRWLREMAGDSRCLLIVTGKGKGGEGPLRRSLRGWLEASPWSARIQAIVPAARHHGGEGAVYVLLRRPKKAG